MNMKNRLLAVTLILLLSAPAFAGSRIKDIGHVSGVRGNTLMGYGLVTGLNKTGDKKQTLFTQQSLLNMLDKLGMTVGSNLRVENVAGVIVTAELPASKAIAGLGTLCELEDSRHNMVVRLIDLPLLYTMQLGLALQSKLLRVLEDHRVRPVGSEREVPFDARFVFATNADLQSRVEAGTFRADLYFRINVIQISLPPLRARGDDVQELAALSMREISQQLGMPPVPIDNKVRASLARYDWPGNIRELRNLIERTVILGAFPEDFEKTVDDGDKGGHSLAAVERRHILSTLRETNGDREEAACRLGISRKTIDRKCASWTI